MIRHVAGVAEIVEDVDEAVRFYRDVLGLKVTYQEGAGYATAEVPGVLHFGLWSREAAAKATYGDASAADRIPLGFTLGFEVNSVEEAAELLKARGLSLAQPPKKEEWGQITSRFYSPGGALCEISETPWARRITQSMKAGDAS
ncbi:MAG: VOC family protein [Chloroflexi bacterium]|nr:VOC family protein [Chloroflexota bacterium]